MTRLTIRGSVLGLVLVGLATTAQAQRLSNPLDPGLPLAYAQYYGITPTLGDPAYSVQSYYYYDPARSYLASRPAFNPYAFGPTAPFVAGLGTQSLVAPAYAPPAYGSPYGYGGCGSAGYGYGSGIGAPAPGYGYGGPSPYINPVRSPRDFLSFGQ